jgi:hypothetical protein
LSGLLGWLPYLLSAAVGFALVHLKDWRITAATLAGTVAGLVPAMLLFWTAPRDNRSPWETVEFATNASVCLIFAAVGAAVALAIKHAGDREA